ncbi:MAG: DUF423 domain-containing protein [Planctomycetota bacterium]
MESSKRPWWILLSISGASAVALGAFAAHGLEGVLTSRDWEPALVEKRLGQFETSTRYHLAHSVVLLALAVGVSPQRFRIASTLFVLGIIFFCGSLYLLVLTNQTWLGAITPVGGLCWIVAWVLLAFAGRPAMRAESHDE